jgi:hypothetical protein
MIKKLETWLRHIFCDEVGKVETHLKEAFTSEMQRIETSFAAEREKWFAEVRDTIADDLKQFRADLIVENLLRAAPQHWQADSESVKADHQIRHPRPERR